MKYLKTYNELVDTKSHLRERGIDPEHNDVFINDKGDVYFNIYNMSGQMVGYQKYNPNFPKNISQGMNKPDTKYYTYFGEEYKGKKIGAWGIESIKPGDKYLFIVEGIFDAARIHQSGYPAIAVFCNDPSNLKQWFDILPQIKVVIYDNDKLDNDPGGKKLIKYGDYAFTVPKGNDMGDLTVFEAQHFIQDIIEEIEPVLNESNISNSIAFKFNYDTVDEGIDLYKKLNKLGFNWVHNIPSYEGYNIHSTLYAVLYFETMRKSIFFSR